MDTVFWPPNADPPLGRHATAQDLPACGHVCHVLHVYCVEAGQVDSKQNLTIQLDRAIIRKAKVLAAKRGTSIGALVAAQIEESVRAEDAYESARRHALELLGRGLHLGGGRLDRESLHER